MKTHKPMKANIYKSNLLMLLLVVFSLATHGLYAQGNSNAKKTEQNIIGTWTFNYEASFAKMEQTSKALYDSIAPANRLEVDNVYRGRKATFQADGSYVQILADGRASRAIWAIDKNGKNLIITTPSGDIYTQKIKVLTSSTLVLKPKVNGEGKMLVSEWHFTKN